MELKAVGILVSYRCSIACRHCYINCNPERSGVLEFDLAERVLRQVKELGLSGMNVHLGGGEPFLYFDQLVEIVRTAGRLGMTPLYWIETNCFWCTSDLLVEERFRILKGEGNRRLWISTDPYHQEFVPFENVRRAYRIGVEVFGEENVHVSHREYFENPEIGHDLGAYVESSPPMLMGRAFRCLRRYLPRRPLVEIALETCPERVDPMKMHEIHINPDGTVMAWNCSGILIGDARRQSLVEIIRGNDWRKNDILRTIADRGPAGLLDLAPDFEPEPTYAHKCELCWQVRSALAKDHPETLGPPECYAES